MGYTDTMLDQARAKLDAGQTAAVWELTTVIAKAEPENGRAWNLMDDIIAPVSPERANRYREKARAAESVSNTVSPLHRPGAAQPQHAPPMMLYQPSLAKLQLGQDIARAEGDLALQQNNLRALERQPMSARGNRTGGSAVFFIGLFRRSMGTLFAAWPG